MEKVVEKIHVEEGMLIINQHYMALETPDGVLHPADLDEYGQYQPILELMRLISCDADMSGNITGETQAVLQQAFLGQHSLLSHPLGCSREETVRNSNILQAIHPKTESDYVRTLSLVHATGLFCHAETSYPFTSREELREYLCEFMDDEYAYKLSESVRKGLLNEGAVGHQARWEAYKEPLALLPDSIVNLFSRIIYLPKKSIMQYIVHYAILAANSLIKNENSVIV
jgi:hypothetical protein